MKDDIYDLRLKYTIPALGSAENLLKPAESHPKLRKDHLSPREGSLRSEKGPFVLTANTLRQTADIISSAEGLVRSTKSPSGLQRTFLLS